MSPPKPVEKRRALRLVHLDAANPNKPLKDRRATIKKLADRAQTNPEEEKEVMHHLADLFTRSRGTLKERETIRLDADSEFLFLSAPKNFISDHLESALLEDLKSENPKIQKDAAEDLWRVAKQGDISTTLLELILRRARDSKSEAGAVKSVESALAHLGDEKLGELATNHLVGATMSDRSAIAQAAYKILTKRYPGKEDQQRLYANFFRIDLTHPDHKVRRKAQEQLSYAFARNQIAEADKKELHEFADKASMASLFRGLGEEDPPALDNAFEKLWGSAKQGKISNTLLQFLLRKMRVPEEAPAAVASVKSTVDNLDNEQFGSIAKHHLIALTMHDKAAVTDDANKALKQKFPEKTDQQRLYADFFKTELTHKDQEVRGWAKANLSLALVQKKIAVADEGLLKKLARQK